MRNNNITMGGGDKLKPLLQCYKNNNFFSGSLKNDWWKLFLPYLLAFGLMLLNTKGYYWDDFGAVGDFSLEEMASQFIQNGNFWYGYFDWIFISAQPYGIALFRFFTFIGFFICAMFVYEICRSLNLLQKQELFFIVLLFLLLPFNTTSRNVLINSPYTFCYILFFVGFYFLNLYIKKENIFYRIGSLLIFFVSFTMNSLLVFYALALIYIIYMTKSYNSLSKFFKWIFKYIDFIVLPFIFYILKANFFKPHGLYEGYNALHLNALLKACIKTPIFSFVHLAHIGYILLGTLIFIALFVALFILFKRIKEKAIVKRDVLGVMLGFIILWLGMFSYVAVYKYPGFLQLDDRHSILESLGAACIIVFTLNILFKHSLSRLVALGLLTACAIHVNIAAQTEVFSAYIKQVGIFENLIENPIFQKYDTFLYQGFAGQGIADESFYQLNGLYKKLSGKSDKYIALAIQLEEEAVSYCSKTPIYNCEEYRGDIKQYAQIFITPQLKEHTFYGFLSFCKMYLLNIFNPATFAQKAKNRYEVIVIPPNIHDIN